jgi:hypothetical protein
VERQAQERRKGHELAPYSLSAPRVGMGVATAFLMYGGDGSLLSKPAEEANYAGWRRGSTVSGKATDRGISPRQDAGRYAGSYSSRRSRY